MDYEGLFGKEIILSDGLNSLEVKMLGFHLSYAANLCTVPIIAFIPPALSPLLLLLTLDLSRKEFSECKEEGGCFKKEH